MPMLIRLEGGVARAAADRFVELEEDGTTTGSGGLIVSLARLRAEGDVLVERQGSLGVRLVNSEDVLSLEAFAPRLDLIALEFPKFRDGRAFSQARLIRERLRFGGELRALGEVLLEQALPMMRCGFDAFVPSDGTSPEDWTAAARRYRYVYQAAADGRTPAFAQRRGGARAL